MNPNQKKKILLVFSVMFGMFLLADVGWGDSGDSFSDQSTGISFPRYLGGLRRGTIRNFERQQPGLGISVAYNAEPGVAATIYVYNYGLENIPNSVQQAEVTNQISQAERDLYEMEKRGRYKSVVKLSEGVVPLGRAEAPLARWAYFSLNMEGIDTLSHLYLAVYKSHFIKIRFSYPGEEETEGKVALSEFIDGIGRLLTVSAPAPQQPQKIAP